MSVLRAFRNYWDIPDPVRLGKVEDTSSNFEAIVFGFKVSTVLTFGLLLFLFLGLIL